MPISFAETIRGEKKLKTFLALLLMKKHCQVLNEQRNFHHPRCSHRHLQASNIVLKIQVRGLWRWICQISGLKFPYLGYRCSTGGSATAANNRKQILSPRKAESFVMSSNQSGPFLIFWLQSSASPFLSDALVCVLLRSNCVISLCAR